MDENEIDVESSADVEKAESNNEIVDNIDNTATEHVADTTKSKKKNKSKKTAVRIVKEIVSYVAILIVAFMLAVLINIYAIRKSDVVGTSMLPSYINGQSVLISRMPYIFGEPERGDVIVFDSTKEHRTFFVDFSSTLKDNALTRVFYDESQIYNSSHRYYIKRVIGIEGDVITVTDGIMYINGEVLKNDGYQIYEPDYTYFACEGMSWTVGEGELFVMGDNRGNSEDSRVIGTIPIECILGKVVKD